MVRSGAEATADNPKPFTSPPRLNYANPIRDPVPEGPLELRQGGAPKQPEAGDICQAVLPRRFVERPLRYPGGGGLKLGSATVTLRYTIDERGRVEAASMAVVYEQSVATRPQYFDLFATSARSAVKRYRYRFVDATDTCSRRQERMMAFEFRAS